MSAAETLQSSHRPNGRIVDAIASTLAWQLRPTFLSTTVCTCHRDHCPVGKLTFCSLFAGRRYSCQWRLNLTHLLPSAFQPSFICAGTHVQKSPSPRWETHVLLVVCRAAVSLLGVAQCPSHRAPSVGTQLQLCARSCSKLPIAPMGTLLTCLPRLTLAQLQMLRSTTVGTCHTETLQISHRPSGKMVDVLASTLACTTAADALVTYRMYVP